MAKSRRGGRRATPATAAAPATQTPAAASSPGTSMPPPQTAQPQQSQLNWNNPQNVKVTPPTPQQVAAGQTLPNGGVPFSQFESMTDDQKANVISAALSQATPAFLDDSGLQSFAYFTGMNDKPQVVSESQLKAMRGPSLWRSVHDTYDSTDDIGYKGSEIYNQIATGDFTMYSDSGGSAYGKAIYFDTSKGSYGSGAGYTIIHAKAAPNARGIDYWTNRNAWRAERRSGSALARAISQADTDSQESLYALAKGYDYLYDGTNGYRMFLNRRGMAISSTTF